MTKDKAKLFIISGPSGAGKSTVIELVMDMLDDVFFSISMTTREPRSGEVNGVDYHFVEEAAFLRMIEEDGFLEHAQYVGNHYGTPRAPVEESVNRGVDVLLDIEVQGAMQVKERWDDAVSVFIMPPSLEALEMRLRNRKTNTEEQIRGRIERAREELPFAAQYDYIVINDDVKTAAHELCSIIVAEKCRTANRLDYIL